MKDTIRAWAAVQDDVRTAILTGSRACVAGPEPDDLSDYDLILFLDEPSARVTSDAWLSDFGDVLVWIPERLRHLDHEVPTRLVQYVAGHRIDFTLSTVEILRVLSILAELPPWLDAGYEVLVDKDGVSGTMVPPNGRGYAGRTPEADVLVAEVREFWWEALVVGKQLARGEFVAAAYSLEAVMRHGLLRGMVERLAAARSGWTQSFGPVGRGLEDRELVGLLQGGGVQEASAAADPWQAVEALLDAYSAVAHEVLDQLGAEYPAAVEEGARARLSMLRLRGD